MFIMLEFGMLCSEDKLKNHKKAKMDVSLLKVNLFSVVQLLLIDAHKAGIKHPEAIFIKAIKTADVGKKHTRGKRAVHLADNDVTDLEEDDDSNYPSMNKEQKVLAQIFRELDDLKMFSSAKKGALGMASEQVEMSKESEEQSKSF